MSKLLLMSVSYTHLDVYKRQPFYAVKLVPVTYHTMGGPKKSVKAEVLDPFGEPIPRLYVAGELGSTWGLTYQGACANADAMVFGRVAGKNAAALENWK